MSNNIARVPLLRTLAVRAFSSGQPAPAGGVPNYDIQTTTLPNKLVVASAENLSPLSRVSVVVRAGSRNETPDNVGAAHVLRIAAGLSTRNNSHFAIVRNLQQVGATLTASADREVIAYTLEGTRAAVQKSLPFLAEVVTQQVFKPWEVSDSVPRLRLELAQRPPQLRAVDLLHKAAFRRGLGNSLFIPKYRLGNISSETLQHYVASTFLTGRAAVVGLGVDHADLQDYAQSLALDQGEGKTPVSEYKGGEIRSDKAGDYAFIAVGANGAGLANEKEALSFAVLQRALGAGSSVKWSTNDHGVLQSTLGGCVSDPFALASFNYSYADAGLFGVLAAGQPSSAGRLVETAVKVLKSGQVPDENIARAKNQLKTQLLLQTESGSQAVNNFGLQAVVTGSVKTPAQLAEAVDAVSASDVKAAAKKVASSKLSIASYGNLRSVPYLDEIK